MEYLDRSTLPNTALNLQCSNLFVVETILKKRRRGKRKDKEQKRMSDEGQEIAEEKEKERNDFSSTLLRYN